MSRSVGTGSPAKVERRRVIPFNWGGGPRCTKEAPELGPSTAHGKLTASPDAVRHVSGRIHSWRHEHPGRLLGGLTFLLGTTAIVLVRYATITLPYRKALHVQGASILLIVVLMFVVGVVRRGRLQIPWRELTYPLAGLGLWTMAAVVGAVIGFRRGNDPTLLAGQLLSLGLLPLGALAGFALSDHGAWRWFRGGLVGATTAAVLLHLGYWVRSLAKGVLFDRLVFNNKVSPTGVCLLALLLALSLVIGPTRRQRVGGSLCATAIVLYIFGSAVRSLWAVTALALVALVVVAASRVGPSARRLLFLSAAILSCILVACCSIVVWLQPVRPNLLPASGSASRLKATPFDAGIVPVGEEHGGFAFSWVPSTTRSVLVGKISVGEGGPYRLRAWIRGSGSTGIRIALHCSDSCNRYCGSGYLRSNSMGTWRLAESTFMLPAESSVCSLHLEADRDATSAWLARPVSLERLGDLSALSVLAVQLHSMWVRTASMTVDLQTGGGTQDWGVAVRLTETAAVLAALREATPAEKVLGHGLGATFPFRTGGLDDRGEWQQVGVQNYVHNFYLFLIYKLGIVGGAAIIAALAMWACWTVESARRLLPAESGIFLTAVAVAWAAYALWSVACPEILDFRVAPLWGLLLTASANASAPKEGEAPTSRDAESTPAAPAVG